MPGGKKNSPLQLHMCVCMCVCVVAKFPRLNALCTHTELVSRLLFAFE